MSLHWPKALERIAWPIAFVAGLPAAMVAARILLPEGPVEVLASRTRDAAIEKVRAVGKPRKAGGSGLSSYLWNALLLGAAFVMIDEYAGLDILHTALGADILPKTELQRGLRRHRAAWREAKASGDPATVRETFFRLKRERFGLMGVRYQEEAMRTPWDTGERSSEMLDPRDVRVFFLLAEGSTRVAAKIYIAFNADPGEPGVREKVDRTTRWILTRQVESRLAEARLEMPCRLERAYRDRGEGEHLVQWGRNEDGSHTLADAWDRRRTVFVPGDGQIAELLRDLDNAHDRVSEHWCKFHENYMTSSSLLAYIGLHRRFLTHFLVDEYTSTPALRDAKSSNVHDWACDMAGLVQAHSTAESDPNDSDLEYQRSIVSPLEEMGLNQAHVEEKIRILAAVPRGQSCGYVRRIIRQCDWQKLAEALPDDRKLAIDLFEPRTVFESAFDEKTRSAVVKSIDNITDKYFTNLSSPTKYTLSKHAIGASAKHSFANGSNELVIPSGGMDEVNRSIHDIGAGGFKGLGTGLTLGLGSHTASSRLSRDEKTPLMSPKDKV
ncbi:hypothetical protein INS49_009017 [Diaporthe citri]|uniref:uncharacterized protein n=1 Tax=Diaporthe citri TaxID=83186 RepID=UPI001C808406|nr:uncharacterized protein INS49_009017 [Diaporthe citri]KAG6363914.1 hypothetical protein INS49_009017 [Diaporthe citri]